MDRLDCSYSIFYDLPDECVSLILLKLSPLHALLAQRTCKRFRRLANSLLYWEFWKSKIPQILTIGYFGRGQCKWSQLERGCSCNNPFPRISCKVDSDLFCGGTKGMKIETPWSRKDGARSCWQVCRRQDGSGVKAGHPWFLPYSVHSVSPLFCVYESGNWYCVDTFKIALPQSLHRLHDPRIKVLRFIQWALKLARNWASAGLQGISYDGQQLLKYGRRWRGLEDRLLQLDYYVEYVKCLGNLDVTDVKGPLLKRAAFFNSKGLFQERVDLSEVYEETDVVSQPFC